MDTLSRDRHALTLVVVEQPSTGRAVAKALKKIGDAIDLSRTFIVHGFRHTQVDFQFPSDIPWRQFPVTLDPVYRPMGRPLHRPLHHPLHEASNMYLGYRLPIPSEDAGQDSLYLKDTKLRTMLREESEIRLVQACDSNARGAWLFNRTCQDLLGSEGFTPAFNLSLYKLDPKFVDRSVRAMLAGKSNAKSERLYKGELLERRFEFNWWINAHALLRPLLQQAGLSSQLALCKYELQLAFDLADRGPFSHAYLLNTLWSWKGTGKYPPGPMGYRTSYMRTLENLVSSGILEKSDGQHFSVTEAGRAFLSALPKDCRDADLPFRLAKWCESPEESRSRVDAYLHKWFSKVKASIPHPSKDQLP